MDISGGYVSCFSGAAIDNRSTGKITISGTATLNWFVCDSAGAVMGESRHTGASLVIPTNLIAGTYYYRCRATAENAETVDSNVARVTVEPTGTRELVLGTGGLKAFDSVYYGQLFTSVSANLDVPWKVLPR